MVGLPIFNYLLLSFHVFPCCPQELCELLDIRMVEIRRRWQDGRLQAIGFRWAGGAGWKVAASGL